jgi:hypothetical protein
MPPLAYLQSRNQYAPMRDGYSIVPVQLEVKKQRGLPENPRVLC